MKFILKYLYIFVFISVGIVASCFFIRSVFYDKVVCKNVNIANATLRSVSNILTDSKRHERGNTKCQSCMVRIPKLIIQFGPPRSATTLQFQILCLIMALLHEDEINDVSCHFKKISATKYNVIKTHSLERYLTNISNSWIFMTAKYFEKQLNISKWKIKDEVITVPYIAYKNVVSELGHLIVYEYQYIFNLSHYQMYIISEYLRYWDILRLCCGTQMSADWRNVLLRKHFRKSHDPHSSSYPACEMYELSQVENLLIKTYAYKKFAHIASLCTVIGKPSNTDGKLDGNYCKICNKNITLKNLKFNQKCV